MGVLINGAVIYKSRYGATEQYAGWIGGELKLPVLAPERLDESIISACDFLIIGTSVYMGKLLIKDWLGHHKKLLMGKKLFLFIVCGSAALDLQAQDQIIKTNLPEGLFTPESIFFLPGRLSRKDLSLADRMLLRLGARLEEDPIKKASMSHDIDAVKKENITDIIKAVRGFAAKLSPPSPLADRDEPIFPC